MELSKVPTWAYGAGAAVVALAVISRGSGASGPRVTTVGPVANPNAAADLQARVSGFGQVTGFASKLVAEDMQLAQLNTAVTLAGIQSGSQRAIAEISAETERARIQSANDVATRQSANQLAASRSAGKASVWNTIISTAGKVIGSIFGFR